MFSFTVTVKVIIFAAVRLFMHETYLITYVDEKYGNSQPSNKNTLLYLQLTVDALVGSVQQFVYFYVCQDCIS